MTGMVWPGEPVVVWEADQLRRRRRVVPRRRRVSVTLVRSVFAGLLGAVAVLKGLAVLLPPARVLPAEVVGVWRSADPRYAGRALELQPGSVTIHSAAGLAAPHRVRRVTSRLYSSTQVEYEIEYLEGAASGRILVRLEVPTGLLRLERPGDVVWYRGERSGAPKR